MNQLIDNYNNMACQNILCSMPKLLVPDIVVRNNSDLADKINKN